MLLLPLRCPTCKKGIFYSCEEPKAKRNRLIKCQSCGEGFQIIDGIYHFYKDRKSVSGVDYTCHDWPQKEFQREKEYERRYGFNDAWLLSLPFPEIEIETTFQKKGGALGKNFFDVLDRIHLNGKEHIFDMAAGCCWTSNEFAKRGCKVVSTDIRTIKYHGLRSAEVYFEAGNPRFERICWKFGRIPFDDSTFDIVFCQNAFQYVEDLSYMTREIYRVLKPFGKFVLAWTGVRAPFKRKSWGPGHRLTQYIYQTRRFKFSMSIFPPVALFDDFGRNVAKEHFGTIPVKFFRMFWNSSLSFRKLIVNSFVPMSFLFGIPFNMVATKIPTK